MRSAPSRRAHRRDARNASRAAAAGCTCVCVWRREPGVATRFQLEDRMEDPAKQLPVLEHIQHLVSEEHRLFEQGSLSDEQNGRLKSIQVQLDQCWDLLRQRRAAQETRRDPAEARVRPPNVVEKY